MQVCPNHLKYQSCVFSSSNHAALWVLLRMLYVRNSGTHLWPERQEAEEEGSWILRPAIVYRRTCVLLREGVIGGEKKKSGRRRRKEEEERGVYFNRNFFYMGLLIFSFFIILLFKGKTRDVPLFQPYSIAWCFLEFLCNQEHDTKNSGCSHA